MTDPEVINLGPRPRADRQMMHVLYAMHTLAWLTAGVLAVIAVMANYLRRGDEADPLYRAHHDWMIRTFWWTLAWMVATSPLYLLLVFPGVLAQSIVGLWYLYRCLRGWLHFRDGVRP